MHQKALLVDDCLASVGTVNLDSRSCRLNFEATAIAFDAPFCADMAAMLEADFAASHELHTPLADLPLWIRLGAPVARLFAPLL